jgi:NADH-quinone oxidoreductase subunit M
MSMPWLSLLISVPLIAGIFLLFARSDERSSRLIALGITIIAGLSALLLNATFQAGADLQYVERHEWLKTIGFEYYLGVDGISLVFVLLTAVVFVMGVLASGQLKQLDGAYYGLVLLLEGGLIGTFTTQNFLHFFLFWELSLIPAFFLVKLYGGTRRSEAALQFFLYTMVGSIAMLIAFLAIGFGAGTLNFPELSNAANGGLSRALNTSGLGEKRTGIVVFLLAFAGIAVKVPIWPLHSWQPLTYSEAPTPVTMMLTGAMSKMGVYGLIRLILPIFPAQIEALHRPLLALALITIIYGAFSALGQRDIKRLFSYSSLSHLGYCFLGIFAAARATAPGFENERAAAVNGVILQSLSHGIVAAALFAFICFLENRTNGLRTFENFGGLRKVNPKFAGLMGIAIFASLGLPGLSGFPAEFLIFKGSFTLAPFATSIAVLGLLLTALYLLTFYGQVFFGPINEKRAANSELNAAESAIVLPAIVLAFFLGLVPQVAIALFNPAVTQLVGNIRF